MGIVGVSQKKGYKIAKWVLLGFGCLFFLLGGVFMLTGIGVSNIRPQKIYFTAAGLTANEEEGYYSLDVFKKDTTVHVNTGPWGSARRVTFTIEEGDDCLEVTPSIWPGESAVLTLKGDSNTAYQFGRTVRILVKSGQAQEFLYVNIVLPSDQVTFGFQIYNELTGLDMPGNTISAQAYKNEVYRNYPESVAHTRYASSYVLNTKFMVWGAEIRQASESDVASGNTSGRVVINAVPQGAVDEVRLFGVPPNSVDFPDLPNGFHNIYIPIGVLRAVLENPSQSASVTIRFMITGDYLGKKHIDFFELKIVK